MSSRRRHRGRFLTAIDRPLVWAAAYLFLLIPIFALVYDHSAGSFVQTSATHEPAYINNKFDLLQAIAVDVDRINAAEAHADFKTDTGLRLSEPSDVVLDGNNLLLTIDLYSHRTQQFVALPISVSIRQAARLPDASGERPLIYSLPIGSTPVIALASDDSLGLFEEYSTTNNDPYLILSTNDYAKYTQVVAASQGYVDGLPNQLSRMIYFSAVTATTLGFGDIAPVTQASRYLVTGEAVLGVVLVGLFLNAIARGRVIVEPPASPPQVIIPFVQPKPDPGPAAPAVRAPTARPLPLKRPDRRQASKPQRVPRSRSMRNGPYV